MSRAMKNAHRSSDEHSLPKHILQKQVVLEPTVWAHWYKQEKSAESILTLWNCDDLQLSGTVTGSVERRMPRYFVTKFLTS